MAFASFCGDTCFHDLAGLGFGFFVFLYGKGGGSWVFSCLGGLSRGDGALVVEESGADAKLELAESVVRQVMASLQQLVEPALKLLFEKDLFALVSSMVQQCLGLMAPLMLLLVVRLVASAMVIVALEGWLSLP